VVEEQGENIQIILLDTEVRVLSDKGLKVCHVLGEEISHLYRGKREGKREGKR